MNLVCPPLSDPISTTAGKIPCLVIENRPLFRSLLCDLSSAMDGCKTDLVLSLDEKILDIAKYTELLSDFICFDINKKPLVNRIIAALEQEATSPEHHLKTQALLAEVNSAIDSWSFPFPCDIIPEKLSPSTLLKAAGIELRTDYTGHRGEVEKVLDYMELVREFDRDKLFITVNMRTFFEDDIILQFQKTALSHEFHVLMLESQAYSRLETEQRLTIDADLCVF